jgi:predicted secreted protein
MTDQRSRDVVFVSHCLLNQNARFPGIAVRPGPVRELTGMLGEAGVGIEQLPCPEMSLWGGVNRRWVYGWLQGRPRPLVSLLRPVMPRLLGPARAAYSLACSRMARRTAGTIADFQRGGCRVLGVIAMNDSPTCGLDKTIEITPQTLEDMGNHLHDLPAILPGLLTRGAGPFMRALRREVERRGLGVRFYAFNPWGSLGDEAERIMAGLLQGI